MVRLRVMLRDAEDALVLGFLNRKHHLYEALFPTLAEYVERMDRDPLLHEPFSKTHVFKHFHGGSNSPRKFVGNRTGVVSCIQSKIQTKSIPRFHI